MKFSKKLPIVEITGTNDKVNINPVIKCVDSKRFNNFHIKTECEIIRKNDDIVVFHEIKTIDVENFYTINEWSGNNYYEYELPINGKFKIWLAGPPHNDTKGDILEGFIDLKENDILYIIVGKNNTPSKIKINRAGSVNTLATVKNNQGSIYYNNLSDVDIEYDIIEEYAYIVVKLIELFE